MSRKHRRLIRERNRMRQRGPYGLSTLVRLIASTIDFQAELEKASKAFDDCMRAHRLPPRMFQREPLSMNYDAERSAGAYRVVYGFGARWPDVSCLMPWAVDAADILGTGGPMPSS